MAECINRHKAPMCHKFVFLLFLFKCLLNTVRLSKIEICVFKMQKPKVVFSAVCVSIADLLTTSFYLSPHCELKKNKTKFSSSILRTCLFIVMHFMRVVSFVMLRKRPLWISAYVAPFGFGLSGVFCHACVQTKVLSFLWEGRFVSKNLHGDRCQKLCFF